MFGKQISQKWINMILCTILVIMNVMLIYSVAFINKKIDNEQAAEYRKSRYTQLSQQLADASVFLTNEVRKFVVTGNINNMQNYWNEVNLDKRRDNAIDQLAQSDLPVYEMKLLNIAKQNSDLLISMENRAMALTVKGLHMYGERLPKEVSGYILNTSEKEMTKEEALAAAKDLVFSEEYETSKNIITDSISDFQDAMNQRLSMELSQARIMTRMAMQLQKILIFMLMGMIGVMFFIFYKMVVLPVQTYTEKIRNISGIDESQPFLNPFGSSEMQLLGQKFNEVYQMFMKSSSAKSDFLSSMSHEIRTPLNAIIGYEYLLADTKLDDIQQSYVENISRSSKNLLSIINNILDFSKIEKKGYELDEIHFNLSELFMHMQELFLPQATYKGIEFQISLEKNSCKILKGDAGKLNQIIVNLISNALKFTGSGKVAVQAAARQLEGESQEVKIHVRDTGIGIKQSELEKIFRSFTQADERITRKYGGTGLGLNISKRMTEFLGGTLRVKSVYGKGSEFTVIIPMKRGDENKVDSENKKVEITSFFPVFQDKRVLLVDDNETNLIMEQEILRKLKFEVSTAVKGREAVKKAESVKFDLIFMDLRMPGMDGFTAAKEIRNHGVNADTCILALTGDAEQSAFDRAKKAGINDYLVKPFQTEALAQMALFYLDKKNREKSFGSFSETGNICKKRPVYYLDIRGCSLRFQEDMQLYRELLVRFMNKYEGFILTLGRQENMEQKDLGLQLHTMKGICGTIGADFLMEKIIKMEEIRNQNPFNLNLWEKTGKDTISIYKKTTEEMEKFLNTQKAQADNDLLNNVCIPLENNTSELIIKLQKLLGDGDFSAGDFFQVIEKQLVKSMKKEEFENLKDAVLQFNFEEACKILEKAGLKNV